MPEPKHPKSHRRQSSKSFDRDLAHSNLTATRFLGGSQRSWIQYSGALQPGPASSSSANRTYPSPPVSSTYPVHPAEPSTPASNVPNPLSPKVVSLAGPVENQTPPNPAKEQSSPNTTNAASNISLEPPPPPAASGYEPGPDSPRPRSSAGDVRTTSITGANVTQENHPKNGEQPAQEDSSLLPANTSERHSQNAFSIPSPPVVGGLPRGRSRSQPDDPNTDTSAVHRDKRVRMTHPLSPRPPEPSSPVTPITTPAAEGTPCQTQPQPLAISSEAADPMSLPELAKMLEAWKVGMPDSVHIRIKHMQSACKSRDFQYLAVHQVHAIGTVWPRSLKHLPGFGNMQLEGLKLLGSMLFSNASLPVDFVAKCCEFPLPLGAILQTNLPYTGYIPIAMKTLELLHTKWDELEQKVLSRRIPPLIDEIETLFAIRSPILQKAIYTACYRRLRPTNQDDKWRQRYDEVYLQNERYYLQRWNRNRTTPVPVGERKAQNQELIMAYQQILLDERAEGGPGILTSSIIPGTAMPTATSGPSPQPAQKLSAQTQPTPPQSTQPQPAQPIHTQSVPAPTPIRSMPTQPVVPARSMATVTTTPPPLTQPQPPQHHPQLHQPTQPQAPQYRVAQPQYQPTQRQFAQARPIQASAEQIHVLRQFMNNEQTTPSTGSHTAGNPQSAQPSYQPSSILWHNGVAYAVPAQVISAVGNFAIPSTSHQVTSQLNSGARPAFVVPSMGTSQVQQTSQSPVSHPASQHHTQAFSQAFAPVSPQTASQPPSQSVYPTFAQSYPQYAPQSVPSPAPQPKRPEDFVPNTRTPIFPRNGHIPPIPAQPDPLIMGLHMPHLLISHRNLGPDGKEDPCKRLCQYVHSYAKPPFCLGKEKSLFEFKIQVGTNDFKRLAKPIPTPPDHPIAYGVTEGSLIYQLRCSRVDSPTEVPSPEKWVELECSWPAAIYIMVNGVEHHIRRKVHYGKDLPVIITKDLQEGDNDITLAFVRGPDEYKTTFWAVAIERVVAVDHERIIQAIAKRPGPECVKRILQKLNKPSTVGKDDDVCIVDEHISIDLVDPFTARIFKVPVRGTHCVHPECFDLETYLDTRRSKTKRGNGMAEAWKCPLCGAYASPSNLYVDEFLVSVREELVKRGQIESVKAIIVKSDGKWEVRAKRPSELKSHLQTPMSAKPDGIMPMGKAASQCPTPGGSTGPASASASPATRVPEIIELD